MKDSIYRREETEYVMKRSKRHLTGVPEGKQKKNRVEATAEEIIVGIFPELIKTSIQRIKNSLQSHSG